jgi:hypothetical protein
MRVSLSLATLRVSLSGAIQTPAAPPGHITIKNRSEPSRLEEILETTQHRDFELIGLGEREDWYLHF